MIYWLFLCALLPGLRGFDYSDLEALGLACPEHDSCAEYRNGVTYLDRSCECDDGCAIYRDCCLDAEAKSSEAPGLRKDLDCLHYGEHLFSGVYAVTRCDDRWEGSQEIQEKCEGPLDLSDPISASPVTSRDRRVTYKNLYCAECNHAEKKSLQFFLHKLACKGLDDLPKEEVREYLEFDQDKNAWGVHRTNDEGESTFHECPIIFDVPGYLNRSVRFCRANVVSQCASNWTRESVRRLCGSYTSVVFDTEGGFRNPHCALCNYRKISSLSCSMDFVRRRRPFSFSDILDINRAESQCPQNQVYDPFARRCRKLACALPRHEVRNNKCVKSY